jgi:solute carrier family 25 citrate transporter 1
MPANISFLGVGRRIVQREGPLAVYKGLGAVVSGIVPKMAIRFFSFEFYKDLMADSQGQVTFGKTFLAGLGAGITEAVHLFSYLFNQLSMIFKRALIRL